MKIGTSTSLASVLVVALLAHPGCSPSTWGARIERPDRVVLTRDNPTVYTLDGNRIGEKAGSLPARIGDTVTAIAVQLVSWRSSKVVRFFTVERPGTDFVLLADDDGYGIRAREIARYPLTFYVPALVASTAWARATDFIVRRSSLKIETAGENILETYTPTERHCDGCVGVSVARIPGPDSTGFTVKAYTNRGAGDPFADDWAHWLAYFMATGDE